MSCFTESLVVTPHPEGDRWILLSAFGYEVGGEGSRDVIKIDTGFNTDFASIPRPLWAFLPRCGKYANAAVIHDYLYWEQSRSRKESDAILLEGMEILQVRWITRYTIYWGVRAGGWWAWWRNPSKKRKPV